MRIRFSAVICAAVFAVITPIASSFAQQDWRDGSQYVRVQGGLDLMLKRKADAETGTSGRLVFSSGFDIAFAVGMSLSNGGRAEIEASYMRVPTNRLEVDREGMTIAADFDYITSFFNLGYDVPITDNLILQGQVGVGAAYRFKTKVALPMAPDMMMAGGGAGGGEDEGPTDARFSETFGFAANLGGGLLYRVRNNLYIGPSYRFIWITDRGGLSTDTYGHQMNMDMQILF